LRGLNDPELRDSYLVVRLSEPPRSDLLTVVRDPVRGAKSTLGSVVPHDLARFWIEGGRLMFQWTSPLPASLVAPSSALRDCVLEVHGDQSTLKIALRQLLVDTRGLKAGEGARSLAWTRDVDRPNRRVQMRGCEIRMHGKWRDLPPDPDPNHRE